MHHDRLHSAIRKSVPERPGVYLFFGGDRRVSYVGKSVNLKKRMLSYFHRNWPAVDIRIGEMVSGARDFRYHETETELLALLMEDELIKEYLPRYNTRQKEFAEYRYLMLTGEDYPACRETSCPEEGEGQRIFGPFRDRYLLDDVVWVIHNVLNLRACGESPPVKKCVNFELGRCPGPCRHEISPSEYTGIVDRVVDFLNGEEMYVLDEMESAMESAASEHRFETAAELRDKMAFCRRLCTRQRFIQKFKTQVLTLTERGSKEWTYVFVRGRLAAHGHALADAEVDRNAYEQESDARFLLDRANIVYSWINKHSESCDYAFEAVKSGSESIGEGPEPRPPRG